LEDPSIEGVRQYGAEETVLLSERERQAMKKA